MPVSDLERRFFRDVLQPQGIAQPLKGHRLDARKQGVIHVSCGDGDHYKDIFDHLATACAYDGQPSRVHAIALNGGALLLPRTSPLNQQLHEDAVLMHHVAVSRILKSIDTVALYMHWPCGAARLAELGFVSALDLLVDAKRRLKDELPPRVDRDGVLQSVKVACFLHLHLAENETELRRTHHIATCRWAESSADLAHQFAEMAALERSEPLRAVSAAE